MDHVDLHAKAPSCHRTLRGDRFGIKVKCNNLMFFEVGIKMAKNH